MPAWHFDEQLGEAGIGAHALQVRHALWPVRVRLTAGRVKTLDPFLDPFTAGNALCLGLDGLLQRRVVLRLALTIRTGPGLRFDRSEASGELVPLALCGGRLGAQESDAFGQPPLDLFRVVLLGRLWRRLRRLYRGLCLWPRLLLRLAHECRAEPPTWLPEACASAAGAAGAIIGTFISTFAQPGWRSPLRAKSWRGPRPPSPSDRPRSSWRTPRRDRGRTGRRRRGAVR